MTINEAIEVLEMEIKKPSRLPTDFAIDALKLGIEALKLVKDKRGYPEYIIPRLLPGETEE